MTTKPDDDDDNPPISALQLNSSVHYAMSGSAMSLDGGATSAIECAMSNLSRHFVVSDAAKVDKTCILASLSLLFVEADGGPSAMDLSTLTSAKLSVPTCYNTCI